MARVNTCSSADKDDSDALELALAFVDECDLLNGIDHHSGQDHDGDVAAVPSSSMVSLLLSHGGSGVSANSSARPRAASKKQRRQQQQHIQTHKPEPTTKVSTPPSSSATAGMSTTTKAPTRKDELSYLRAKVRELHVRLALLQKSSINGSPQQKQQHRDAVDVLIEDKDDTTSSAPRRRPSPEFLAQHRAMWENVAIRQSKEREKVERENAQLKSLLESQLKVAKGLERILRKRGNVEIFRSPGAFKKIKLCRGDSPADESVLLEESSQELDRIYASVDELFESVGIDAMASDSRDTRIKNDPKQGMHVQFIDKNLIKFDLAIASAAVWKFISQEGMKSVCYYHEDFESTEDTIGRFFGMKIKENQAKCDIRGINTVRKFTEASRTVFTWLTIVEPIAFSGAPIAGIRFREHGSMILRPSSGTLTANQGEQLKSYTQLQMCCRLTPDIDSEGNNPSGAAESLDTSSIAVGSSNGGIGGGSVMVGALTDFLINAIEGNIAFTNMMVDQFLQQAETLSESQGERQV